MYVKVFDTILGSTINEAPTDVRWAWIAILVLKNKEGFVSGSPAHLARSANIPLASMEKALELFQSPDRQSTTPSEDGRRLLCVSPNLWFVVNHEKYDKITNHIERNEQSRQGMAKLRASRKSNDSNDVSKCYQPLTDVSESLPLDVAIDVPVPVTTTLPVPVQESEQATVTPEGAPTRQRQKPVYDKRVRLNVETWEVEGLTHEDRQQFMAIAPGLAIDPTIQLFIEYAQTHPKWLQDRLATGAWKAALNTWFRNQAKYSGNNGTSVPVRNQSNERVAKAIPLGCDKYGNEYSAVTLAREWGITQKEFDDVG